MSSTYATFVNKDSNESINIIINGEPMVLTKDGCIQFNRYIGEGENILTLAKILDFGGNGKKINRDNWDY